MTYMTIGEFRAATGAARKRLAANDTIVLTANGRPFAKVTPLPPPEAEAEAATLRGERFRAALKACQDSAKQAGTSGMSLAQINAIIRDARRERAKR